MKTLKEKIEVMQAADSGKEIQVIKIYSSGNWWTTDRPDWSWDSQDYRIKPKPIELLVNIYEDGTYFAVQEERGLAVNNRKHILSKTIKVREIIE